MKRTLLSVLTAGMSAIVAAPAFAHAGDHEHSSFLANVVHFLTSLDHLLPLAAAVGVITICLAKPALVMRAVRAITRSHTK